MTNPPLLKPLFSPEGIARLEAIVQPGMLCVFDFDGTLAPIVSQPHQAQLPADVRARLLALQRLAPVAILTGRALEDVAARLDFKADFMVGNHGLEGLPNSDERRMAFEQECAGWHGQLANAFKDHEHFDPGFLMEDKKISLSIHYRHVQDQTHAQLQLTKLFATLTPPPRVIGGKCVFNLLPQGAGDKGTAFEALMQLSGAKTAVYVGDDVTDEDVFRLSRQDLLSIRIGENIASAAQFTVAGYSEILPLLDEFITRLDAATGRNQASSPDNLP